MGQVFVAENLSIGRRVAIKMLKAELLADPTFRRRFQQEAQAIAAIEHRNVARFFDLVVGDPTFLVMEFVPGPTLASLVRDKKPLDPVRAINIARRLCWALDAAHEAGVIHRDIKPSNVILSPDVESGDEPKLIDFGLAKLASNTSGEGLTRTGQIIGTPSYMSPEQIANQDVDARSDVYSLGCVLYEMLTGAAPFAGMEDVQVLYKQLHEDPPTPRSRVPSLPLEIDAVVARSMAKDPAARYPSMQAMAKALAKIDRRRGREHDIHTEPRLDMGRPAYGLALAAFVVGALSAGGGVWFGSQQRPSGAAILVTSQPSGATVEVDGRRWRETTPTAVSGLAPGRHTVHVSADAHGALDQTVMLERDARASIELALPAIERAVAVQTIPAGAMVFVDGHLAQGRTPLMVNVGRDDFHELRLELDGFETETRALKPEDHDPTVMVHLEAAHEERGTLWVDGPSTSEVYLDGAPMAPAPTIGLQVMTGTHEVELRSQDGSVLAQKTITMKRGQTLHVAPLDVAKLAR
jgi:tRNA A-37 threonylcarbamoyl transferase component Bud32